MIPLAQCEHRRLYLLDALHLRCGVYSAPHHGFFGIKTSKTGDDIHIERHSDVAFTPGTAKPTRALDIVVPDAIELETAVLVKPGDPGFDPDVANGLMYYGKPALYAWLREQEYLWRG